MLKLNENVKQAMAVELAKARESNTFEGSDIFQLLMKQLEDDAVAANKLTGTDHDDICEMADLICESNNANEEGKDVN